MPYQEPPSILPAPCGATFPSAKQHCIVATGWQASPCAVINSCHIVLFALETKRIRRSLSKGVSRRLPFVAVKYRAQVSATHVSQGADKIESAKSITVILGDRCVAISIYVNPCLRLRLASSIVHLARFIHQALPQRKAPNPKPTILSSAVKARTPGYLSKWADVEKERKRR